MTSDGDGLALRVLGELTASRDGQQLDLGGRKQRAVLALLLLARGDVVPADRLVDSLWGEEPPPSAASALHAYVSHLRKRLEPQRSARSRDSVIARQGPGYALRVDSKSVDSWLFEQRLQLAASLTDPADQAETLTEALILWQGPAFADYSGEPWVESEVARLDELREVAREQLLAARLGTGETAVVVPELEALVADNPLREERWRLLVLALYRSHRQADALAALRRARQTLADELGVDPGPALRALEAEVLAQSPNLDAPVARPAAVAAAVAAPASPRGALPPTEPAADLVDRDRELSDLAHSLADAAEARGRLVVVEGPPGIGKSRLLGEARRLAANAGALMVNARGSQLEKEFGFGVVRQLFEPALAEPGRREALMAGAAAPAATVFDEALPAEGYRADGSFAVLHGLYWLAVNLAAERTLVIAIDDLQWCDTGSLRFLAYLARRLDGLDVLVVATVRTGDVHEDEALLAEIIQDPDVVAIRPAPLSWDGVADLVRHRLGEHADDAFISACYRTTSGNPLLLRQLLRALEVDGIRPDASHADTVTAIGSRAVSSMVLMRLSRLSTVSTAVAHALAVLGDGAELPVVAALAELPESEVAAAVAALARAEVVRDDYPLGFVHPLVQDAVYRDLPPGTRELHHQRAARVLAAADAAPEQVAAHLLQVPRRGDAWVVDVLRQAARRASERGASDGAMTYLQRALAEPPDAGLRTDVLIELGRLETMGDGPAALQHLAEAYYSMPPSTRRGHVAQMLARTLVFAGGHGEATAFAHSAAAALPPEADDERQGLLGLERISGFMHGLDESQWRGGDVPEVVGDGPGARMLSAALAWEELIDGVNRDRCIELARFALEGRVLLDVDAGLLWVVAAMVQEMSDEDISYFWDEALADAYRRGSLFASLSVHLWRGYMLWRRGDLVEALASLGTSHEQTEMWGAPAIGQPYVEAFIIGVLLDRGEDEAASEFLEQVRPLARLGDGARLFVEADAKVLIAQGRFDEALRRLVALDAVRDPIRNPVWRPWRSLRAQALAGLGRHEEAAALLEEELDIVSVWGARSTIGRTTRLLGEVRTDPDLARKELEEAVALLSGTRARLQLARAHYALALVVPPEEAVTQLHEAIALAEACGALGLRREAADALRGHGVEPPPPSAATALTTTERRMTEMAAAGIDERDIAQAMFVTPGTVAATLASVRERLALP